MPDETKTNDSSLNAYWSRTAAERLAELRGAPEGLSSANARARLLEAGPNVLKPRRRDSALRAFLAQFANPLVLILKI